MVVVMIVVVMVVVMKVVISAVQTPVFQLRLFYSFELRLQLFTYVDSGCFISISGSLVTR
jgi:hypothetical protein